MKTFKPIVSILVYTFALFSFGCQKDEVEIEFDIIGSWESDQYVIQNYLNSKLTISDTLDCNKLMTFDSNGTGTISYYEGDLKENFEWELINNNLHIKEGEPSPQKDFKIKVLSENYIELIKSEKIYSIVLVEKYFYKRK